MIKIISATAKNYPTIRDIAHETWPIAYGEILSKAQLDYMLGAFYNDEALNDSVVNKGHHFVLAKEREEILGFASYEHHYDQNNQTKIHKIYVLPQTQGKGIGKKLIDYVENVAKENDSTELVLNVNRFNKALFFYQKMGFEIASEIDIELEHGYLMEDFVMIKKL
ncbi:GNAT family N-acetyltransferase [Flavobacterium gilvum]|uniref:GNAT family N-acetyltransferase n=1 Tax=Flavobacterium gilvum TaxID=1492737 RepID=A0AAC9N622_9FLAO|nr:GNAT family N-acetyltransferase [Flavobacterium gilvum]AOW10631.1 GNAT family N-acetyltransferase [Flavobacterium gilvum]KFC59079.1 acetyltransferase [Flavobacterium gilvum]